MKLGSILTYPRVLVYLRQIVRELKRANDLTEARLSPRAQSRYKAGPDGKNPKLVSIATPTTAEWNKIWKEQHPESYEDLE